MEHGGEALSITVWTWSGWVQNSGVYEHKGDRK